LREGLLSGASKASGRGGGIRAVGYDDAGGGKRDGFVDFSLGGRGCQRTCFFDEGVADFLLTGRDGEKKEGGFRRKGPG